MKKLTKVKVQTKEYFSKWKKNINLLKKVKILDEKKSDYLRTLSFFCFKRFLNEKHRKKETKVNSYLTKYTLFIRLKYSISTIISYSKNLFSSSKEI